MIVKKSYVQFSTMSGYTIALPLLAALISVVRCGSLADSISCYEKMKQMPSCEKDISNIGFVELKDPNFCFLTENLMCDLSYKESCVVDKATMRGKCCKLPQSCLDSCTGSAAPVLHDPPAAAANVAVAPPVIAAVTPAAIAAVTPAAIAAATPAAIVAATATVPPVPETQPQPQPHAEPMAAADQPAENPPADHPMM